MQAENKPFSPVAFLDRFAPRTLVIVMVVLAAAASLAAIFTMPIVDHDTGRFFRPYFLEFWRGTYEYYTGPIEPFGDDFDAMVPSYINIPHAALMLPFVLGMHWASFWVAFSITLVYLGDLRRPLMALGRMPYLLSAYAFFAFSAANLIAATAFGLLILLQRAKGWWRGFAWALLMIRPQDSLPWLLYDGVQALRERDWRAFVTTGAVLVFPALVYGPGIYLDWLTIMRNYSTEGAREDFAVVNFSLVYNTGIALALSAGVVVLRFVRWAGGRPRLRGWGEMPYTEKLWLMCVAWYISQPYGTYTMLWLIVFGVRVFKPGRALLTYALLLAVSLYGFTVFDPVRAVWGVVLSIYVMALLFPRDRAQMDLPPHEFPPSVPAGGPAAAPASP